MKSSTLTETLCMCKLDSEWHHSLARAFALACAGWLFLGHPTISGAQQVKADRSIFDRITAAAEKGGATEQSMLGHIYSEGLLGVDRKSTRLNSSHLGISYAV